MRGFLSPQRKLTLQNAENFVHTTTRTLFLFFSALVVLPVLQSVD